MKINALTVSMLLAEAEDRKPSLDGDRLTDNAVEIARWALQRDAEATDYAQRLTRILSLYEDD